jgi:hypothetical protein
VHEQPRREFQPFRRTHQSAQAGHGGAQRAGDTASGLARRRQHCDGAGAGRVAEVLYDLEARGQPDAGQVAGVFVARAQLAQGSRITAPQRNRAAAIGEDGRQRRAPGAGAEHEKRRRCHARVVVAQCF